MSPSVHQALVRRLVAGCRGYNRPLVYREACQVVTWAGRALDSKVIDEEIGRYVARERCPVLPRAVVPAIRERARLAHIELPGGLGEWG